MAKRYIVVSCILFFSLLNSGLASARSPNGEADKKETSPYLANFSYTPEHPKARGSSGVTFTISAPVYVSDTKSTQGKDWRNSSSFSQLTAALKEDISEILVAKGFNVRGPFDSYDIIPYPEKKQIDLYLIPTLELFATWKDTNVETQNTGFSGKAYRGTGTIEISGRLVINLQEIMTRELMWTKGIPISYSFPYDVRFPYFDTGSRPFDMGLVIDSMAKGLEQQYSGILTTFSNLLNTEEMHVIKRQAQAAKSK